MRKLATLTAAAALIFGITAGSAIADVVVDLVADNGDGLGGIVVGDVTVSGAANNFTVTYDTSAASAGNGDWLIVEIHTHAVNEDDCSTVPQTGKGNPKVGRFDFGTEVTVAAAVDTLSHTILNLDGDDGTVDNDIVCIAAHAVVFDDTDGGTRQENFDNTEETAWGDGDGGTEFASDRQWATFFTVDVVAEL